ncbi:MAG: hypothetical protein M3011_04555, partial [Actinomycetota bacterium]|nr:hypothetical protein [Actinomycetota bacterium]
NQEAAWYAGAIGEPAGWLALATRRPAVMVTGSDLAALSAAHPQDLVMVGRTHCIDGDPYRSYAFETPADVVARPPAVGNC